MVATMVVTMVVLSKQSIRFDSITKKHCRSSYKSYRRAIHLQQQNKYKHQTTSGAGYGLSTYDTSSIIHLLFPLTQESVSTNNHGGGNYGGKGEIAIVDDDGNTIEIINEAN